MLFYIIEYTGTLVWVICLFPCISGSYIYKLLVRIAEDILLCIVPKYVIRDTWKLFKMFYLLNVWILLFLGSRLTKWVTQNLNDPKGCPKYGVLVIANDFWNLQTWR